MQYAEYAALYLEASLYRANIVKHCMRDRRWVCGTLVLVTRGLERQGNLLLGSDWCAPLRTQTLVEVGAEYVLQENEPEQALIFLRAVNGALNTVASFTARRPRDPNLLRVIDESLHRCAETMERFAHSAR